MSTIRDRITGEIKAAMKARETTRLATLRMIKAEILKKETAAGAKEMDEVGLIALLQSMKKQREDSIRQFEKGGRPELADRERAEIAVLETFLPEQLRDEELADVVAETIEEMGVSGMKSMGPVIKAVRVKVAGRADGKRISEAVKARLAAQI